MDNSLSFTDVVGQYVKLTPVSNSHFSGRCPFCMAEEDTLILSVKNQHWVCLACEAAGDRYDFVARSENIGKAEAILLVAHHTNSGKHFPHAQFWNGISLHPEAVPAQTPAAASPARPDNFYSRAAMAQAPTVSSLIQPETVQPATIEEPPVLAPDTVQEADISEMLAPFQEFRKIIPSYQAVAVFDSTSKMICCDCQKTFAPEQAGIGAVLEPIFSDVAKLLSVWGKNTVSPATLAFYTDELAVVAHRLVVADKTKLLVLLLSNPADVAVARRLIANAANKLT